MYIMNSDEEPVDADAEELRQGLGLPSAKKRGKLVVMTNVETRNKAESDATNDANSKTSSGSTRAAPKKKKTVHKAEKVRKAKKWERENKGKGARDPDLEILCLVCGKPGHMKRNCPNRDKRKGDRRGKGMSQADMRDQFDRMSGASEAIREMGEELRELREEVNGQRDEEKEAKAELKSLIMEAAEIRCRKKAIGKVYKDRRFVSVELLPVIFACFLVFTYWMLVDFVWGRFTVAELTIYLYYPVLFSARRLIIAIVLSAVPVLWLYVCPWRMFRAEIWKLGDTQTMLDDHLDWRFDANALLELKHRDPIWAKVNFRLYVAGILWPWYQRDAWVSLEKFAQAMHPANQELDADDETVTRRIKASVRTIHAVNDDRYRAFVSTTSYDVAALAYTAFRDYQFERRFFLFGGLHAPFTHPKDLPRY